jgi:hypothetical protein
MVMDAATLNNNTIIVHGEQSGLHMSSNIVYNSSNKTVTFNPDRNFFIGEHVFVTITTDIENISGDSLLFPFTWGFTIECIEGSGYFVKKDNLSSGSSPHYIISCDLNNDRYIDLVTANFYSGNLSVFYNDGLGNFDKLLAIPAGTNPWMVTSCDLNNDLFLDLVIANDNTNRIIILINDGTGNFSQQSSPIVGLDPRSIEAFDFEGDGDIDLAVANYSSNTISILINNGNGTTFQNVNYDVGDGPISVCSNDFNSDGIADLAVANNGSNTISILLNTTDNNFIHSFTTTDNSPMIILSGDFDADGDPDLATANQSGNASILINDGNGYFNLTTSPLAGDTPQGIVTGDFDNDTDLDLAIANYGTHNASILINNSNGNFINRNEHMTGVHPRSISCGDYDKDGDLDLAIANSGSANITILLNRNSKADILSSTDSLNFSNVIIDSIKILNFKVYNNGADSTLNIINIISSNPAFVPNPTSTSILPGDSVNITVSFTPLDILNYEDSLTIISNDPINSELNIYLSGQGDPIITHSPAQNELNISTNAEISITFGVDMNPQSFNENTIIVNGSQSGRFQDANITYQSGTREAVYMSSNNFLPGEKVSVILTTGIESSKSDPLPDPYLWEFMIYSGDGSGTLEEIATTWSGNSPWEVCSSDFDGDGLLDLAIAETNGEISILKNDGRGYFSEFSKTTVGAKPYGIISGDLNLDGYPDLAVENTNSNSVSILINDHTGNFTNTFVPITGIGPVSITSGDWDLDGDIDMATVNNSSNNISVLINGGTGNFSQSTTTNVGATPWYIINGDWDNDGDLDLATANYDGGNISIISNDGSGKFSEVSTPNVNTNPGIITRGDWDGDSDLDIAVVSDISSSVYLLMNDGLGNFTEESSVNYSNGAWAIHSCDIDGDFNLDLIVPMAGVSFYAILKNDGTGNFSATLNLYGGTTSRGVVTGDFDKDGDVDLVLSNYGTGNITIFKNINRSADIVTLIDSLEYGYIKIDSTISQSIKLYNMGQDSTLKISSILSSDTDFSADKNSVSILPGDSAELQISFKPSHMKTYSDTISILSNDPGEPIRYLFLSGAGNPIVSHYPDQNQINAAKQTSISVKLAAQIDDASLGNAVFVFGSLSGKHDPAELSFQSGSKTLLFQSSKGFSPGEDISVILSTGISSVEGDTLPIPYQFSFNIRVLDGTAEFESDTTMDVGNNPWAMALADFDKDSDLDLAVANFSSHNVTIINNNDGQFSAGMNINTGVNPRSVISADLDSDGDIDLAVTNQNSNAVSILKNNGSGNLSETSRLGVGTQPWNIVAGDWDNDGDIDLATTNISSQDISILINNGTGTFGVQTGISIGGEPFSITGADWDNDGDLDFAITNFSSDKVRFYINGGNGEYIFWYESTVGSQPYAGCSGDWDHDGDMDLAITNYGSNNLSILKNDGSGILTEDYKLPYGNAASYIRHGDWDADGDLDLVMSNEGSNQISLFKNNGIGNFIYVQDITVGNNPRWISVGDLNSDGDLDLTVCNYNSSNISIFQNINRTGLRVHLNFDENPERSGSIDLPYQIINSDNFETSLLCEYSTDNGNLWQAATISGDTSNLNPSQYNGIITWYTQMDLPGLYIPGVKFKISPFDSVGRGTPDSTGNFTIDNYHAQEIALTLQQELPEYADTIAFNYFLTDETNDIHTLRTFYQVSNNEWKNALILEDTTGYSKDKYSGLIHWLSDEDLPEMESNQVRLKIVPFDGWSEGSADSVDSIYLDNNTPPEIYLDKDFSFEEQQSDISLTYQLNDLSDDTLEIQVYYSIDNGTIWNLADIEGELSQIPPDNYTSSVIWHSQADLPNEDIENLYIKCIPSDKDVGLADSVMFHLDNNLPPVANLQDMTGEQGQTIEFPLMLSDIDNDSISVSCSYKLDDSDTWNIANVSTQLDALPTNKDITIIWPSQTDLSEYSGYLWFKVIPWDNDPGSADSIWILVDNLGVPVIQALTQPEGEQSGEIEIGYTVQDDESDLVNLECFYSTDSSTWQAANTSGELSNISPQNYESNVTWHSGSDLAGKDIERVWFKIVPADAHTGVARSTYAFHVDNNQPPQISQAPYNSPLSGIVDISFQLQDEENDTLAIKAAYHTGTAVWEDMPEVVKTHDNYQDTLYWNTYHDLGFGEYNDVQVRLIPVDNDSGNSNISNSFDVNNYAGDYSGDININYDDLIEFAQAWYEQDLSKEIGPASGQPPLLIPQPDGVIDFEDLMVLVQQWNWSYDHPHMGKLLAKTKQSGHSAVAWSRDQVQRLEKTEAQTEYLWQKEYIDDKDVRIASSINSHLLKPQQSEYDPWNHKFADQLVFHLDTTASVLGYYITIEYDSEVLFVADTENILLADQDGFTLKVIEPQKNTAQFNAIVLGRKINARSWSDGLLKLNITANQEKEVYLTYRWIIHDIQGSIISSGESISAFYSYLAVPETYALHQNFPNPFNPSTTIRYQLPVAGMVQLDIYNTLGQRVIALVDQDQEAGYHSCQWDITTSGKSFASGLYFLQLRVRGQNGSQYKQSKKILLLK